MHAWLSYFVLFCIPFSAVQAEDLYLPFSNDEINVSQYPNAQAEWRIVWLHSQSDRVLSWEYTLLNQLQQNGFEVWATDILGSLFLTRTAGSVRGLSGESVATVLEAAQQASNADGKPIILVAADRMANAALKGVRSWQSHNLEQPTDFKGSIFLFPNLYTSRPIAGKAPNWEDVVNLNQAPVMILQPEQGVHRWYLGDLMQSLSSQHAPVYGWILPGVKDYFYNPFAKQKTDAEQAMTEQMPKLLRLSAQRLASQASSRHPIEQPVLNDLAESDSRASHGMPKLHEFNELKPSPGLVGKTFEGETLNLADIRGDVVLVNFWATWCPPCVTEIPSMNRLLAKYRDQGLQILSVDFQQSAEEIAKFSERVPVDYPIVLDQDGRISKDWGVFSFPTTFVVDRQGRVRYSLNQGVEWDVPEFEAPLKALLNEP
ncbi:TlpA family protein disulfide reductase [Thiomicrospira pelophila]|uniref:TlpA family protein disulfide reductase n=1 Tax=Thiomicrospira pelophila TaxID=934 RepID=UPI0006911EBD|nr:TlpA disulfide reductase family protein [Thiomicrospira pelophila]